jgi:outer membrane protein assembly factor BamB
VGTTVRRARWWWYPFDSADALAVSPDGASVFVTGSSGGSVSYDYATIAYDAATGAELWTQRYDEASAKDVATALVVSPDGTEVFVTGRGRDYGDNFATIAYDASSGAELWRKRSFGGSALLESEAIDVAVSPDGSMIVVTGLRDKLNGYDDWATIAFDASTGAPLWSRRFAGPAGFNDRAVALAMSPDGSAVFVTGLSATAPGSGDYETLAYDTATGTRLWASRYDGPASGDDQVSSLAVSPDGRRLFVTGSSEHRTRHDDYATLALRAATGTRLWAARFDGPISRDDVATALAVPSDSSTVIVTGGSKSSDTSDYATVAYPVRS